MKVRDLSPVQVPSVAGRVAQGSGAKNEVEPKDRVSVNTAELAALDAAHATSDAARDAKVQQVIAAVKSGQYYPSPRQIAQQIVSEAEIEAKLRSMLKG